MSSVILSPKMQRIQRSVRINDGQLLGLADKAKYDARLWGYLQKRCSDSSKWLLRWFRLYQNLLFYYEHENSPRPTGVIFLEGCYCERIFSPPPPGKDEATEKMYCFAIMYRRENQRQYELRAETMSECQSWIDAIKMASFNKLHLQMEELEQKHLHLLQVVESEKTAKWQYTQHCEELTEEIKKLRNELFSLKKDWRLLPKVSKSRSSSKERDSQHSSSGLTDPESDEDPDLVKIKKVQSFFRGWLCRRRWKQIVEEYIRSPHAESMRKRNCLVFRMVEAEEEYVEQLEILISCFLRPFKMAASSKSPPCSHEDINSIFLNSETVLFLHQIFLKGLTARMDSWPTLVLGDLFDMLLPMLSIYQEYVRNHHYCLQVLTECKQSSQFAHLLHRLEKKPACKGRSLETFLTYPMHQIPRYIITLHELLAHTPPDHVEKRALEHARVQLEDLSRQMHDEVSDTENIRKNLAIERMILEGCDILLDVNQMFVRQGTLVQLLPAHSNKSSLAGRLPTALARVDRDRDREREREAVRQCFLFSNHLIVTTRTQAGRLHLVDQIGKISLADVTLIEDPSDEDKHHYDVEEPAVEVQAGEGQSSDAKGGPPAPPHVRSCDFKLLVDDIKTGQQISVHLLAPSLQEKAAWITDIAQCMDSVHFNGLLYNTTPNANSTSLPQCVKSDPNLFKDDVDIRFSKSFNTCKIPQIRYATPERLLQRLTDLRFLNIDFLNTFLLTYRVFTEAITVLEALKKVFFSSDQPLSPHSSMGSLENLGESVNGGNLLNARQTSEDAAGFTDNARRISTCSGYSTATDICGNKASSRRISGASSISGYYSDERERASISLEGGLLATHKTQHWRYSFRKYEEEQRDAIGMDCSSDSFSRLTTRGLSSFNGKAGMGSAAKGWRRESFGVTGENNVETIKEFEEEQVPQITSNDSLDLEVEQESSDKNDSQATAAGSGSGTSADKSKAGEEPGKALAVPEILTASSSAETLTDATLVAMNSPKEPEAKDASVLSDSTTAAPTPAAGAAAPVAAPAAAPTSGPTSSAKAESQRAAAREASPPPVKSRQLEPGTAHAAFPRKYSAPTAGLCAFSMPPPPGCSSRTRARSSSTFSSHSYSCTTQSQDLDMVMGVHEGSKSQPCSHHPSFSSGSGSKPLFGGISFRSLTTGIKSPSNDFKKRHSLLQRMESTDDYCAGSAAISSPQHSKMGVVITSARQAHRSKEQDSSGGKKNASCCASCSSAGCTASVSVSAGVRRPKAKGKSGPGMSLEYLLSEISDDDTSAWSSSSSAAMAFAVATAGCGNPPDPADRRHKHHPVSAARRRCSMTSNVSTLRVLSVLKHWINKHTQDFENDSVLKSMTIEFLEDIICTADLLPSEQRAASQLLRILTRDESLQTKCNLNMLMTPSQVPSSETTHSLSALEIAEQMTYLDQKILFNIQSSELLGQAWTKCQKEEKSPHIMLMTKRFNEMSRLVASEIMNQNDQAQRVAVIEKWTAVADICRCLHNFNGVLQICSAFTNTSVYRLKETWNKVSKPTRQTLEKLQSLVLSDGRFRSLRETLHRTDPPCIPYLGMYLSDLTFIEEGTPNFTDNGLLNFAKMRMIAHVIREIRQFQQTPYKIEPVSKVMDFLLDPTLRLEDEELYQKSLCVEPRSSRLSSSFAHCNLTSSVASRAAKL